jgi:hypothetical protein
VPNTIPMLVAGLLSSTLILAACGGSDDEPSAAPAEDTTTTTTTSLTGDRFDRCPDAPGGSSTAVVDEQTGTYAATIAAYLPSARSMTVDIVQWLVGDEAAEAYRAETGEADGPPNDYYVVNTTPQLRTLPVSPDVTVLLVALSEDSSADVSLHRDDDLVAHLDQGTAGPFWITIEAGQVTQICEQYVP